MLHSISRDRDSFPFDVVMVEADRHDRHKNARVQAMLLNQWGLVQHPIAQSPGSTNQLYMRDSIRDVRPNATTIAHLRAKALSPESKTKLMRHFTRMRMSPFVNRTQASLLITRLMEGLPREMAALLEHMDMPEWSEAEPEE